MGVGWIVAGILVVLAVALHLTWGYLLRSETKHTGSWLLVSGVLAVVMAGALLAEWQTQKRITAWKVIAADTATAAHNTRAHWVKMANAAATERIQLRDELQRARREASTAWAEVARLRRGLATCQAKDAVQTEWIHHLWEAGLVPECRGVPPDSAPKGRMEN